MKAAWTKKITLVRFNNTLSVIIVMLSVYIFVWPFMPRLTFWWHMYTDKTNGYTYQNRIESTNTTKPIPQDNRLVIPGLHMDEAIHDGPTVATLSQGAWRRPQTSTPDKGGNTVIAGHRFTYRESAVFYNLDKVQKNDPIIVYWEGKEYDYIVDEVAVVRPTAVEIESPTPDSRLTIYTCTPLWTAKDRLVVKARLIQ
ncbi:MAG: putative sortase family protein [Candidatus Saccharibacteria bacterium]|nr:putative sortase family protein [Candidatus Saccharibacteria bacterium]